jgi:hypothetical protein
MRPHVTPVLAGALLLCACGKHSQQPQTSAPQPTSSPSVAASAANAALSDICDLGPEAGWKAATVAGGQPLHFARGGQGCPSNAAACQRKAYVVPGNAVLIGAAQGGWVCAHFPSSDTYGWLPQAQLTPVPAHAPSLADWAGHWAYYDDSIDISVKGTGLKVSGQAFWPSAHPGPGQPGPNDGEVEGDTTPNNDTALVVDDPKDPSSCRLTLRLIGPFLSASDNGNCGGMNVRFDGVYARKKA